MRFQVLAPVRVAQGIVEHLDALLQGARRLEERRDLQLVGDAVVACQPEGGEQRVAGLGLGDRNRTGWVPSTCLRIWAIVIISRAAEARSAASAPKSTATGRTSFRSAWIVARCERRRAASVGSPSRSITRRTALWIWLAFSRKCGRAFDRPCVATPDAGRDPALVGRVPGRLEGLGESGDEGAGIGLGALALDDQRQGEPMHRFQRRLSPRRGATASCRFDRRQRPLGQGADLAAGRDLGQLAHHPVELHPLGDQPVAQGVPPADIGPPVGVAADPAGDGEGAGGQIGPAFGPTGRGRRRAGHR